MLALSFAVLPLAGCFQAPATPPATAGAGASVARLQVIDVTDLDAEDLSDIEDPDALLRTLIDASFVVRVDQAGDYALTFTDARGASRTQTLEAMAPGEPRTVPDVDPLSGATLARDGVVVYERPSAQHEWWRVGPAPLGVAFAPGAAADYAFEWGAFSDMEVSDIDIPSANAHIDLARFQLRLPIQGTFGWESHDDGANGQRVAFSIDTRLAPDAKDLMLTEFSGSTEEASGTVGFLVPSMDSWSTGGFSLWAKDGELRAARLDGASYAYEMKTLYWAEGTAAEQMPFSCDGPATRAEPCALFEQPRIEKTVPRGEMHAWDESDLNLPAPGTPDAQEWEVMRAFIDKLLAQGFVVGDAFTIRGSVPAPASGPFDDASASVEFLLEVAARETVTVPAGSFDAFRIAETARVTLSFDAIRDPSTGERVMREFHMDETVSRMTTWLDARTNQPLKAVSESPLDVDRVLHQFVEAIDTDVWDGLGMAPPDAESYHWTATGAITLEAQRIDGDTTFAPYVGLLFGKLLSTTAPFMGAGLAGAGYAQEYLDGFGADRPHNMPQKAISLTSTGGLHDGVKTYTVAAASAGLTWGDLRVTVDGVERPFGDGASCTGGFDVAACSAGQPVGPDDIVRAGDMLSLGQLSSGETLRVLDASASTVMLALTVR